MAERFRSAGRPLLYNFRVSLLDAEEWNRNEHTGSEPGQQPVGSHQEPHRFHSTS